jgi:hypothetical protein
MSRYEYFTSLANLSIVEKDGKTMFSWEIVDKPRAGTGPKAPKKDPRSGQTFLADVSVAVKPTAGLWKVNFSIDTETGVYEARELTPTNVRAKIRLLGLPDVERALGKGEKPVALREPKIAEMGRYVISKIELDSGPWAGLTATVFLNAEPIHLSTSTRGKLTRDFLRFGLNLPADADLVKELAQMRGIDGEVGEEWVKVHEALLQHAGKVQRGEAKPVRVFINGTGAVSEIYQED